MSKALNVVGRLWQGPAIMVEQVGRSRPLIKLGAGEAKTTVTLPANLSLKKLFANPSLNFGEGYMQRNIVVKGSLMDILLGYHHTVSLLQKWRRRLLLSSVKLRPTPVPVATANARHHYDIGNNFYQLWLDPSLTYSCAYFPEGNETLAEAQEKKRDRICRKLEMDTSGLTLLDIGCGWGSLIFHAAERYGAKVTGLTAAKEQAQYIQREAVRRGLTDQVKVIVGDWRQHQGPAYDRLVSVGMFEHVGQPQYPAFFAAWRALLKPGGTSLLHTIGHTNATPPDPWIDKYIFPGGYLPTAQELKEQTVAAGLVMPAQAGAGLPAWENLRPHYATTLSLWAKNYTAARSQIIAHFDEEFYRMWWLYLQAAEAGFRAGDLHLYQMVLKHGA